VWVSWGDEEHIDGGRGLLWVWRTLSIQCTPTHFLQLQWALSNSLSFDFVVTSSNPVQPKRQPKMPEAFVSLNTSTQLAGPAITRNPSAGWNIFHGHRPRASTSSPWLPRVGCPAGHTDQLKGAFQCLTHLSVSARIQCRCLHCMPGCKRRQ
jgi:hypothetical protein